MPIETNERDKWFYKSVNELIDLIDKAGLTRKLRSFNDVLQGKEAPSRQGWGEPVLKDVEIDGRICDIYHTDKKQGDSGHRIYIHIKE